MTNTPGNGPETMTITVLFFASVAERLGVRSKALTITAATRAGTVLDALRAEFGSGSDVFAGVRLAVNERYADGQTELHDGDTLAIIPPVSGG